MTPSIGTTLWPSSLRRLMLVQEMLPVTFLQVVDHGIMDGLAKNIIGNTPRRSERLRNSERHTVVVKDTVAYGTT